MTRSGSSRAGRRGRRARRIAFALWVVVAFGVWNAIFDLMVSRGEKQYFWDLARFELGEGPPVDLKGHMAATIDRAATVASIWGGLVLAAGIGTTAYVARAAREPEIPARPQRPATENARD